MLCTLCYESSEDSIDLTSDEAIQLQVPSTLYKHFQFCFETEPCSGVVCRKCWWKVEMFHQLYLRIEEIHRMLNKTETIFHQCLTVTQSSIEIKEWKDSRDTPSNNRLMKSEHQHLDVSVPKNEGPSFTSISYMTQCRNNDPEKDKPSKKKDFIANDTTSSGKIQKIKIQKSPNESKKMKSKTTRKDKSKDTKFQTFQCDTCYQYFLTENKLLRHKKKTHLALPFRCIHYQCVESFLTATELDQHRANDHAKAACQHCGKMIAVGQIQRHIKFVHEMDRSVLCVVCDLCGKVSANKHMHKRHFKIEHETRERLQCDLCKDWFKSKETIRTHMNLVHIEQTQTCSICGKISPNRKALRDHKRIHIESTKDRYKCIVCGKGFRHSTKLREHSYIHSGVTDAYVCNFCGKTFRFGSSWSAHRMKQHPAEMEEVKIRLQRKKNLGFKV